MKTPLPIILVVIMATLMAISNAWMTAKYADTLKSICLTVDGYEIE